MWKKTETTTEWATLIGPDNDRVWVSTDIPVNQIPGQNDTDTVVFRDAATGREWSIPGFVHTWFCVTQLRQVALL